MTVIGRPSISMAAITWMRRPIPSKDSKVRAMSASETPSSRATASAASALSTLWRPGRFRVSSVDAAEPDRTTENRVRGPSATMPVATRFAPVSIP